MEEKGGSGASVLERGETAQARRTIESRKFHPKKARPPPEKCHSAWAKPLWRR